MADADERLHILEMIDGGQISAEEGIKLLNALSGKGQAVLSPETPAQESPSQARESRSVSESAAVEQPVIVPIQEEAQPEPASAVEEKPATPSLGANAQKWRRWWWIPVWVGVGITLVGAMLMFWAWQSGGYGFWFACSWFPFLLGILVMVAAWAARSARWLHVRVHQKLGKSPQKIAISLPIPLRLTAWFFRKFGHHIPNLEVTGLDEVIIALERTSPDTPFYVEVNKGEDGERVEVYIG